MATETERLNPGATLRFTLLASLMAIFADAAVGHGLLWENDPYWTYWVTKTFLLATVIGLGTAWAGIGAGRGAAIIGVQTIVLTVYYWSLSPIGMPSSAEWLDLEHTWITGLPVHFTVLYVGYLAALWLWRRREAGAAAQPEDAGTMATRALFLGALLVLGIGLLSWAALGDFPGVTWFVVRLLLTVPLLMFWWSWAGRDAVAAVGGAIFLAFIWATYGHYLGPEGLPDMPLRIFDPDPPSASVRFLDYRELWVISLPIYLVVAAVVLLFDARRTVGTISLRRALTPAAALAVALLVTGSTVSPASRGQTAKLSASGALRVGSMHSTSFENGTGTITIRATDMGGRVTSLPPHDRLVIDASFESGGKSYAVMVRNAMITDPLGRHTTWWGVGFDVEHHGRSGIGTKMLPTIDSELAAYGLGEVTVDGELVATGVPVHVMTAGEGIPGKLELDLGDEEIGVAGLANKQMRVIWSDYSGSVSKKPELARYAGGAIVLLLLLWALLALNRREVRVSAA